MLIAPNDGEGVEQQELSFVAGGNSKWYSHFKRQFGGFYKTKGIFTIPGIAHYGIYLKELKTWST